MSDIRKIIKYYIISCILILITTMAFCGIYFAEYETSKMLFG